MDISNKPIPKPPKLTRVQSAVIGKKVVSELSKKPVKKVGKK